MLSPGLGPLGDVSWGGNAPLNDLDFLHALHLSFHELQLMRLERRPLKQHGQRARGRPRGMHMRSELLLGDIHTEKMKRDKYRPTALQPYALVKMGKVSER